MMKKICALFIMLMVVFSANAQEDITTFLGIPVTGTKSAMRQKLIEKGFTPKKVNNTEYLEGEFNGHDVNVYIATNNNKVYRIMLCDKHYVNEANIKTRFNKLVSQFENNKRYTTLSEYTIPEDEDISYEMSVHSKNYEANFYQNVDEDKVDKDAMYDAVYQELLKKYTQEQIESRSEEILDDVYQATMRYYFDIMSNKSVWFKICESYGEYYIAMFYDNEYNHANGEDL